MSPERDRRKALIEASTLNGIDFVSFRAPPELGETDGREAIAKGALSVHFMTRVPVVGNVALARITGGWPTQSTRVIRIQHRDWSWDAAGRPVLTLVVPAPGNFSTYRLTLDGSALDPYFATAQFSFEADTPRTVDCEAPDAIAPPVKEALPTIDYLAKDFASFRQVLSDYSAQAYPAWQERSEADFGVMFMESLCSIADDLSYQQDRIAAEAFLDTATQRLSVVRQARLVDYEPRPATAARVLLVFTATGTGTSIPSGLAVSGLNPDGTNVIFETGEGIADEKSYPASAMWNEMSPYWWDESARRLPAGATDMWIDTDGLQLRAGIRLLVATSLPSAGDRLLQVVTLVDAVESVDPVYKKPVTHIFWRSDDALRDDRDLACTTVSGNLVPATQGERIDSEPFVIVDPVGQAAQAVVRTGANGTPQYLYTPAHSPLAWLASNTDPSLPPSPEILVVATSDGFPWSWVNSLLDVGPLQQVFTVDPGAYRPVGSARPDGTIPMDYAGDPGDTLRFGDGTYGALPDSTESFQVTYRIGAGAAGNVPPGSITSISDPTLSKLASAVTNPFPARGGADPETIDHVRRIAPDAFSKVLLRAVAPGDYECQARTLPWVQTVRTRFRHTGSWLSAFTWVAANSSHIPSHAHQRALASLLERRRMAGCASFVSAPRYVSLDIDVTVHAKRGAFRDDVRAAVAKRLSATQFPDGTAGFFRDGRFGFGQALKRHDLVASIKHVQGVDWISHIMVRRRGGTDGYTELPSELVVAHDEIIRVDGDPRRPDAGSVRVDVRGGQ